MVSVLALPVPSLSSHVKVQEKNEDSGLGVAKKKHYRNELIYCSENASGFCSSSCDP